MIQSSYSNLISRLTALRSHYAKNQLLYGILLILAGVLILGLMGFLMGSLFTLPTVIRIIYLAVFFLVLSIGFSWFCLRVLIYKPSLESLALKIEENYPQLKNRLIGSLQLYDKLKENPFGFSTDMIEAVIQQADKISKDFNFKEVLDKKPLKKISKIASVLAVVFLALAFIFPASLNFSFYVFSHPLTEIELPQKFHLFVSPGDFEAVKYSDVEIKIKAEGEKPSWARLFWRNQGASWNQEELGRKEKPKEKDFDFGYTFKEVKRSFDYYVEAEGIKSDQYRVKVVDKPRVIDLKLTFNYPKYTRLQTVVLDENDGNINAVKGTEVTIEAKSNKPLKSASLIFKEAVEKDMQVERNKATAQIRILKDDSYHIQLSDSSDNKNQDPIEYTITAVSDDYPQVEIIEPGEDRDLTENMTLRLFIKAEDDYGFSSFKLIYQTLSAGMISEEEILNIHARMLDKSEVEVDYLWDLSDIGLVPSDVVKYRVEVYDNDNVSGPKKGVSKSYHARLPSIAEIIREIDKKHSDQIVDLEELQKEEEKLQKKLEKLSRELLRETKMDWGKKKETEEILKDQQELAEKLKDLAKSMESSCSKLEENRLATLEMIEKMMELRKLLEEVAPPELKEAIQKLQEALSQLDPEKIREALNKMEFSAEEMIKRMDRTIALLKRMKAEQKMDTVVKMLEDLNQKQEEINEKLKETDEDKISELKDEERAVLKNTDFLEENLNQLGDLLAELDLLPESDIEELGDLVDRSGIKEALSEMIENLSRNNQARSLESGSLCSAKFAEMLQFACSIKGKMQKGSLDEIVAGIRKAIFNLLYLSENQETLLKKTQRLNDGDLNLRELAGQELNLKTGGTQVAKDLEELSLKSYFISPDIGRSISKSLAMMREAVKYLYEKNRTPALISEREALYGLNQTAKMLMEAMENVGGSCSGSGMEKLFSQLQACCNKQQGINQQTLGFENMGGGLSLEEQAQLERLAAQQEAVKKSVEELSQEFGERKEILGSLDKLGDEIAEVVKDLQNQEVSEKTIRAQEQILSRLLDAEKSLTKRDYSKDRKAEVGEDIARKGPEELPFDLGEKDRLDREWLKKVFEESYPKEYEELIQKYFEKLTQEKHR
jgi:hypothetical protein